LLKSRLPMSSRIRRPAAKARRRSLNSVSGASRCREGPDPSIPGREWR
jgi:hypothetical protein